MSITLLSYNIIIINTLNLISPSDDVLLIIFILGGKRFIFTMIEKKNLYIVLLPCLIN